MNLQDSFLNQVRMQKIPVTMYLLGGHQIKGMITGFDPFIIMLDCAGRQMVVYKHAVSTITPLKPVSLSRNNEDKTNMQGVPHGEN